MHRILIPLLTALLFFISPASALYVEVSDYGSGIASAGVKDVISGRYGDVIFATDGGISVYRENGTWYSVNARHPGETAYGMLAPLDTMVTAVALDAGGNLWAGYPNGLQIGDGAGFHAIQDLQFLKNLNINCMARWGDGMWVAVGRAGLHCCRDGEWTWYKPAGPEGLGCHTVVSMAVDAANDLLVIGSESDGIRVLKGGTGDIRFEPVTYHNDTLCGVSEVRADPFGGVYLFNSTTVLHYTPGAGVTPVLTAGDLSTFPVGINDVAATREGMLLIASDNGIYGWNGSDVALHVTSEDGIRSNVVKKLFVDASGRCWFVVPGNVGYIPPVAEHTALVLSAVPVREMPEATETPFLSTPAPEATIEESTPGLFEGIRALIEGWIAAVIPG